MFHNTERCAVCGFPRVVVVLPKQRIPPRQCGALRKDVQQFPGLSGGTTSLPAAEEGGVPGFRFRCQGQSCCVRTQRPGFRFRYRNINAADGALVCFHNQEGPRSMRFPACLYHYTPTPHCRLTLVAAGLICRNPVSRLASWRKCVMLGIPTAFFRTNALI